MEARWKADWDYLGWRKYSDLLTSQNDWNQTLMTQINFVSKLMWDGTKHCDVKTIKVNSNTYKILEALEYLHVKNKDGVAKISLARYDVILDETIENNKMLLLADDRNSNSILFKFPKVVLVIETEDTNDYGMTENRLSFMREDNPELEERKNQPNTRIITPDMLVGEITIQNIKQYE